MSPTATATRDKKKPPAKPAKNLGSGERRAEIDPKTLAPEDAKKRVGTIYALEKKVETKRAAHAIAKSAAKAAKAALSTAEEELEQEIRDQRYGPGPLFNAKGDGPAAPAKPGANSTAKAGPIHAAKADSKPETK